MTDHGVIGVHFIPTHTGQQHYNFIAALQPYLAKLVGGEFPDVQQMADMYQAAPDALHIWRNHALSEQHADLWSNPVGTAQRHVAELHRDITWRYQQAKERGLTLPDRGQVRLIGINEPVVELFKREEDGSNYGDWLRMMRERTPLLDAYMLNFGEAANALGYGAELGNFPTGTPANLRPGGYPTFDWFPRTAKLLEHTRGRNALGQHEYWTAAGGPEAHWDWHTCRFMHYQVDCDIHVLESGVEEAIDNKPHQGWQGLLTAEQYVDQHRRYTLRAMTDARFQGQTPFTLDGGDRWKSHYIEPAMPQFVALATELARKASQPHTVHIPVVVVAPSPDTTSTVQTGAPVQPDNWARAYPHVLHIEGGLSRDEKDVGNWYNGQLVGTKYGISAAVWGGQYDIPNLTREQALAIYREHYWQASGADALPWPMCLVHFDTAVNHGAPVARSLLKIAGDNVILYLSKRLRLYTSLPTWPDHGAGWANRIAHLLQVVAER